VQQSSCEMAFAGLRNVYIDGADELLLGEGFSLVKPNQFLLSARSRHALSEQQWSDAESASRYFVYRHPDPMSVEDDGRQIVEIMQNGLMALQIIKPVQTL
jgi:hypothetical protein